ncbi:Sensor histidine kinase/response regulator [Penicillium angulare]|uniref:Sensor histidine kinase/response regulator n=1 Tax=Penicillium angulare TaxID=116970 RepID=UPI002541A05F|nr:Sensor histidine kinase/response regulator [Penicillium angulare]KAJ5290875.1 Sensor histidine kinase/response regulator [Penicillium angulare]
MGSLWSGNDSEWKVIYDEQGDLHKHLSGGRKTLAQTLSIPKSMCILSDKKTEISTVNELASKLKLPQLRNGTVERVFPVRSVVSLDSTPSSALQIPSLDKFESPAPPWVDSPRNNTDDAIGGLPKGSTTDTDVRDKKPRRPNYLTRMHHQLSLSNISPSLLRVSAQNRDTSGEELSPFAQLQNMIRDGADVLTRDELTKGQGYFYEDETNLVIQPFGALLVVSALNGKTIFQAASTNSGDIIGYTPDDLFKLSSIDRIMSESQWRTFLGHAKCILDDEYDVELCGPELFSLSISTQSGDTKHLWCTMHTSRVYRNYIICELEPDAMNYEASREPLSLSRYEPFVDDVKLEGPTAFPSKGDYQDARAFQPEILNSLPRFIRKISSAQTLESLVHHSMAYFQELSSFQRITMYHFDGDRNGIVVADSLDESLGINPLEGVEFPESSFSEDMKKQYLRNAVSFAYRKGENVAQLAYRASTVKMGLDLSHCYLLASPGSSDIQSSHLSQECLSMGIYVFGKLWGLVCCQSYDERSRLHPLVHRTCWMLRETISSNIERLSYTLPFHVGQLDLTNGSGGVKKELPVPVGDLLSLFGADYAVASILGETKILGKPPDSQEALAILEYLRVKELSTVLWSTDILSDFEDLDYSPGFRNLSGLIYIPLAVDGQDFIVFFRRETGPDHKTRGAGSDCDITTLASDKSIGVDRNGDTEWSAAEIGKASILALLYRTFTEIWQEKEATMQNNQLMRLLLANSAHEFRTPLNAIINYLEIALDGNINQETRDNLSRSHSASKSLVYIINDLLDLTNAENGQRLIKDETFSLSETLCEATDIFWEEARQKHVDLQVVQHAALPAVLGDQRRVRQVITNLISNAVQHTSTGAVTIESCILSESWETGHISVEVAIHDTGSGMSQEAVEALFCELEQVSTKEYMQNPRSYGKGSETAALGTESVLGLGLALVARIVRNMEGQLSLKSEEGQGSCFKLRLKFPLPSGENGASYVSQNATDSDVRCHMKGCDGQRPNGSSCDKQETSGSDQDERRTVEGNDGIDCKCGDPILSGSATGRVDSPLVDADISLKNGESRNLTILASGVKVEDVSLSIYPLDLISVLTYLFPTLKKVPLRPTKKDSSTKATDPEPSKPDEAKTSTKPPEEHQLHVLIAEDDPINSSIVKKRLEKLGYSVYMTSNGKECASVYRDSPISFDVILMDLQVCIGTSAEHLNHILILLLFKMPIVDGFNATKMIREHERQIDTEKTLIHRGTNHSRTPIFALSASLVEKDRQVYFDAGFDGWIMKPIDFQRVHVLLKGVLSIDDRDDALYKPGMWEEGGWFEKKDLCAIMSG